MDHITLYKKYIQDIYVSLKKSGKVGRFCIKISGTFFKYFRKMGNKIKWTNRLHI